MAAIIEKLARIRRHRFDGPMMAMWAGKGRFQQHRRGSGLWEE
jgi:hypothetical protein